MTALQTVVYDIHDFKVYALTADAGASPTYSSAVDVPGIAEVQMQPNFITNELKGDSKIIAKKGRVDRFNFSSTYGRLAIDVLAVILGGTVGDETTPSTGKSWKFKGTNSLPYFKAEFAIDDTEIGTVRVVAWKCQLTGGTLVDGRTDQFGQPTADFEAIPASSNDAFVDVYLYDNTVTLS